MNIIQRYINHLRSIWSKPSKGFGDTVAKITKSLGITPCGACEKRRLSWNEKLAYAKKERENSEKDS